MGDGDISKNRKGLGQFFTVSDQLQRFVFDRVKYKSSLLLEPSFGAGHLLKRFKEYDENYPMVCYEIDSTVKPVVEFNGHQRVIYGDFTKQTIVSKFKTIVGNPPYVKTREGNLYIKFIELCYSYLEENGELIFIVPSDFIKLTRAGSIIETMVKTGSFTDFLFPHRENLFEGAGIDVLVFRYEKGRTDNQTVVNGNDMFCNVNRGIVTFSERLVDGVPLDSLFTVYVGLVSGRDEIYRKDFGNVKLLIDKDKIENYIFAEEYPTGDPRVDSHLETHKSELLGRKIRKFSEDNWFEWGAPRNISSMKRCWGKSCIYVRNMTRNREVAFAGTVQYFGGSLLCLVPRLDMDEIDLERVLSHLNSQAFQKDYIYSGRFKIGQKQISSAIIPN
jgi:adenine-specific DNA-methyltransferase